MVLETENSQLRHVSVSLMKELIANGYKQETFYEQTNVDIFCVIYVAEIPDSYRKILGFQIL